MASPVIQTSLLAKSYGPVAAVRDLDLTVGPGEMFGLVGPDGAGKTTLIRMLCGIIPPDSGRARVLGYDLRTEAEKAKSGIGYLSQRFSLYGDLTVDENLEFFAEIHGVRDYRARREELLGFTRLTPFRGRLAERLSGGMRQKLALACTLIHRPRLLLLDEPTTGVDPVSRRDFWKILSSLLKSEITIVMSTPYLDEAERCSRVGLMDRGRLLRVDTPQGLKAGLTGAVVEIHCRRIREARRVLAASSAVRDVQMFGDRLNVIVDRPADAVPVLRAALAGAGIELDDWRTVPPSLENVFMTMAAGQ
jgi:ABC-2 type transport system ATP-binding protein